MELSRCTPRFVRPSNRNSVPRIFDDFFSPFLNEATFSTPANANSLLVDIYDKDGKIVLVAELPGVAKEDIHVDVKGKLLTVGGERKENTEIKEEDSYRRERKYGKFERTFNLPFEVKEDLVNASFGNGLLTLEIGKPEAEQVKQIKIH